VTLLLQFLWTSHLKQLAAAFVVLAAVVVYDMYVL
jgi:hypothetical protein